MFLKTIKTIKNHTTTVSKTINCFENNKTPLKTIYGAGCVLFKNKHLLQNICYGSQFG
jgi:hypothetical protein